MTETREPDVTEALALIEQSLGTITHRDLLSSDEVADLLLDVRSLLTASEVVEEEPVGAGLV